MIRITLFKGDGSSTSSPSSSLSGSGSGSAGDENKYLSPIAEMGNELKLNLVTRVIPVLGFNFIELESLYKKLQEPQRFSGIIFTSPRCVEAVKRSVDGKMEWESLRAKWSAKYIFCVGPSTALEAKNVFLDGQNQELKIIVSDLGNSEDLGSKIVQDLQKYNLTSSLLYPCGNLKTDTLESILSKANVELDILTVYSTGKNPLLEEALENLLEEEVENTQRIIYVFFSPSGVKYSVPYLGDLIGKFVIAIGPTTKRELDNITSLDKGKIYQCMSPTPEGLCDTLRKLLSNP